MLGGRVLPVRAFRAGRHTVASDSSTGSTKGWTQMAAVAVLTGEVRAEGVGKTIDETTLLLPTDVSGDPGDSLGLRGPTGCGKTSLLRLIGGLLVPSTGTATIGGREADERDRTVRAAVAALLGAPTPHPDLTPLRPP